MTPGGTANKFDEAMTTWPTILDSSTHPLFGTQHWKDLMVYSGQW